MSQECDFLLWWVYSCFKLILTNIRNDINLKISTWLLYLVPKVIFSQRNEITFDIFVLVSFSLILHSTLSQFSKCLRYNMQYQRTNSIHHAVINCFVIFGFNRDQANSFFFWLMLSSFIFIISFNHGQSEIQSKVNMYFVCQYCCLCKWLWRTNQGHAFITSI